MAGGRVLIVMLAALAAASCDASADGKASVKADANPPAAQAESASSANVLNQALIDRRKTPTLDRCMNSGDAAKGYTFPMFDCLSAELNVQDQALNTAYRSLLTVSRRSDAEAAIDRPDDAYGAGWTARIVEAQKAWVTYRDNKCLTENYPDGQMYRFYGYPNCQITETIKRTIELEQLTAFVQEY